MKNVIWKLQNAIKAYPWGSVHGLNVMFGIPNPDMRPQAEIWMGVHPAGCSRAINSANIMMPLDGLIAQAPAAMLGESVSARYHSLPFLFKVLAAASPLSIQVHPSKSKAKQGFAKENQLGIAVDAAHRNYKDTNHKPELMYTLTPFLAMNGFRPITETSAHFADLPCSVLQGYLAQLTQQPNANGLKQFFHDLLTLPAAVKKVAIRQLMDIAASTHEPLAQLILALAHDYPDDIGIFMPMLLNVIELQPGQAMYLDAETPHAYLRGIGMEIMANSDNVLRAGLTPKHIDVPELIANTCFTSIPLSQLLTAPVYHDNVIDFPVPVDDFKFSLLMSDTSAHHQQVASAEILFCLEGEITVSAQQDSWTIRPGESLFVAYCAQTYHYVGQGRLARAYN